jgi:hypothetical protein
MVSVQAATRKGGEHVGQHVRFGSKADSCSALTHVRFSPESGHVRCNWGCPLWAKSGQIATSHFAPVVCATSSKSGSFQLQLR